MMNRSNNVSKEEKKLECEQAIRILLDYLDNELGESDHKAMDEHLHTCRSCFSRMEFEKELKNKIKRIKKASASDTLKARIRKISEQF